MNADQTDRSLWAIMAWLSKGVGKSWSVLALQTTGQIYKIMPDAQEE